MTNGFRVQSLTIEGFKGFTSRQEIDLKGRHVFLLGQNGNGKSSIVEAIRWGLIGSTGRPNEVVANRSHTDACRVILTIMRDDGRWRLQRTMIRGISGGSDARLFDENGQERPLRDVIPQLDSANAGEGTYIVFASQSPRLSRQPEDLEPFERTVFNHLGLINPRSLLSQMNGFLMEQELLEKSQGEKLTTIRDRIDSQIRHVEQQRGQISTSPPWETDHVPSLSESETRARGLIAEITGTSPDQSLSGVSLDGLIDHMEDTLNNRRSQGELKLELEQIADFRKKVEALRDIRNQIRAQQAKITDVKSQRHDILEGAAIDEIRKKVAEEQTKVDATDLRNQIVKEAISLFKLDKADSVLCPVCESLHCRHELESSLQDIASRMDNNSASVLVDLKAQLSQAEELDRQIQSLDKELADLSQNESAIQASIDTADAGEVTLDANESIAEALTRCMDLEASIKAQIDSHEDWIRTMQVRLSNLKRESSFHSLQRELHRLQESRNRFGEVQRTYNNLVAFGESVRAIQQAVETSLTERLEAGLPGVAESLSQVFAALTRHPWYDQLNFAEDKLPKLELRVTSSQDAFRLGDPVEVLNGQAESALELVPYFAFSQTEDAPTEIYLVLLDDPTRAFDEEHIGILVERLAELGRHVQLMVASQETERFRTLLPQHFEPGSYAIVEPARWSRDGGPELAIEYG